MTKEVVSINQEGSFTWPQSFLHVTTEVLVAPCECTNRPVLSGGYRSQLSHIAEQQNWSSTQNTHLTTHVTQISVI